MEYNTGYAFSAIWVWGIEFNVEFAKGALLRIESRIADHQRRQKACRIVFVVMAAGNRSTSFETMVIPVRRCP